MTATPTPEEVVAWLRWMSSQRVPLGLRGEGSKLERAASLIEAGQKAVEALANDHSGKATQCSQCDALTAAREAGYR